MNYLEYVHIKQSLLAEKHTRRIVYSFAIAGFFLLLTFVQTNVVLDFFLTLNVLYFTRELLQKELFDLPEVLTTSTESFLRPDLTDEESAILPANIQTLFKQAYAKRPVISTSTQMHTISDPVAQEQLLITSMQRAEQLIEQKIAELRSKRSYKKDDVQEAQTELKQELVKELPVLEQVPQTDWTTWNPLSFNEKLLDQSIFCVKCQTTNVVKTMDYNITTEQDYYEVVTTHEHETEQHINTTRISKQKYEILSKPLLTVRPLASPLEVLI